MPTAIIQTTFKLKRGTAARWAEVNPVLEQGEPGFVYDNNRLKIGDGVTPWNELPYIDGQGEVINYESSSEFPVEGDSNAIYKAADELSLYQYNAEAKQYEKLVDGKNIDNITTINGGNA